MKQSAKRLLSSLLALALIVATFVVFFNFVQPIYLELNETRGRIVSLGELVKVQREISGEIRNLVQRYEESADARLQVDLAMPSSTAMAEALLDINGIAEINQLSPQTFVASTQTVETSEASRRQVTEVGAASLVQPVGTIAFQVRLVGSYSDFKTFLGMLESNVRIFDVEGIQIQQAGRSDQNLYSFEIRIVAYYQQNPVTGGSPQ